MLYNKDADTKLVMLDYGYDRYIRQSIAQNDENEPALYAIDPVDQHLYINPPNATALNLTAYYYSKPVNMSLESSPDVYIPQSPVEFHSAIVYQAAAEFAAFLGNGDLFTVYSQKASSLVGDLMRKALRKRRVRTRSIA